jgi:hypothetical protein
MYFLNGISAENAAGTAILNEPAQVKINLT